MHNVHCKICTVTAMYFRRLSYIMANDKYRTKSAEIKEQKLSKYKKTVPLFLYFKGKCISIFLLIYILCYNVVITIDDIDLCTLVTK